MKILIILLMSSSFLRLYTQSELPFKNEKIDNNTLVQILNNSQVTNLNKLNPNIEKDLSLKLYTLSKKTAVYGTERFIIKYAYYLAVSEHDEYPDQAVFYLGEFGELTNINWIGRKYDTAILSLDILNFPESILELDPTIKKIRQSITIQITINEIKIII